MKLISRIFSWLIMFLIPVALTFLGLRLLLTHAFLKVEYSMPGFPADSYGFTQADRLHWSRLAVDYLVNDEGISFLGNLIFPDGSPLYNERELSHMLDVKNVIKPGLGVGYAVCAVLLGLAAWARFGGWWNQYLRGLKRGGWLMVGLVAVLGVLGSINFWQFFTIFHELFFKGNSWIFEYSDTLIRLFPLPFWEYGFLFAGIIAVGGGLALGWALKPKAD
jgi:integral membrane protein (TIGR01906 family)